MEKENQIKSIIFDLGNVLIFFDHMIAAKKIAKDFNIPSKKIFEVLSAKTSKFTDSLEKGKDKGEYMKFLKKELGIENVNRKKFGDLWNIMFWPNKELIKIAKKMKKNYKVGILSNIGEMHEKYLSKTYNLSEIASTRIFSYRVGTRKPERKIFQIALKRLKVKPSESIFIDDLPENVEGARKAGMNAILFKNNDQLLRDLNKLGVKINK